MLLSDGRTLGACDSAADSEEGVFLLSLPSSETSFTLGSVLFFVSSVISAAEVLTSPSCSDLSWLFSEEETLEACDSSSDSETDIFLLSLKLLEISLVLSCSSELCI